jgi:hypothetical protein
VRLLALLLIATLVLCLTGCDRATHLTPQEKTVVNELTEKLEPHCVGRYLIDIPHDVLTFGRVEIQGVSIETTLLTQHEYARAMEAREAALKSTKSVLGYQFLYEHGEGQQKGTRYFVHLKSETDPSDASRVIEAYKWDSGYQIKLQIEAVDFTRSKFKDKPSIKQMIIKNDVPEKSHAIFDLLARVRGRPENDIPTEPGVCICGGFLPGNAGAQENVTMQFVLRDSPDVSFDLQTDSDIQESTTLLERGSSINEVLKRNDGRTIRKGQVNLTGMRAEEWLMAGTTTLDIPGHHLTLEANSKIGSPKTPLVTLDMNTGSLNNVQREHIDKASLSEGEVVGLWDAVSRTLRPRPNGF